MESEIVPAAFWVRRYCDRITRALLEFHRNVKLLKYDIGENKSRWINRKHPKRHSHHQLHSSR